jgi:hypothetical protein
VVRVQNWREAHPVYSHPKPKASLPLQDSLPIQKKPKSVGRTSVRQQCVNVGLKSDLVLFRHDEFGGFLGTSRFAS